MRQNIPNLFLFIIGITIAFSLNRWAENSQDRKLRKQYTTSLITDLDAEIKQLEENIAAFRNRLGATDRILPILYGAPGPRDSVPNTIYQLASGISYNPQDITYQTLVNTGDLSLFGSLDLQKRLQKHHAEQRELLKDYTRQDKINENYMGEFMIREIDYTAIRQGNYDFLDKPILRNIIQSLRGSYLIAIAESESFVESSKELKAYLQEGG
jgi:hypothetical protein